MPHGSRRTFELKRDGSRPIVSTEDGPRISSRKGPQRIAMLQLGGREWVGGVIYLENMVRALRLLPDGEAPEIAIVASGAVDRRSLGGGTAGLTIRHYTYRRAMGPARRTASLARGVVKDRRMMSLERLVQELAADVLLPSSTALGRNFPCPWVGWIPDLQHRRLPCFFPTAEIHRRDAQFSRLVQEAPHLILSSQQASADLTEWLDVDPRDTSVLSFPSLIDPASYDDDPAAVASRFDLPERYLIFPSQFWAHKNHGTLFEAIKILRDKRLAEPTVVCTGWPGDSRDPHYFARQQDWIRRHRLERRIRILGLLPRHDQVQLLRRAAGVVQPSLFEGWSLVVEDARALGKRIYVSDIPVHREQSPPDACFFPPDRPDVLAEHIAADWPGLKAGPSAASEDGARLEQQQRGLAFAHAIEAVVTRAVESWR